MPAAAARPRKDKPLRPMIETHTEHTHADPKVEWEKQRDTVRAIEQLGLQRYAENLPDIQSAFELDDHCLRCIDEGTPGGIHLAGSGILMDEVKAIEASKAAKVDGVYSHAGCGAAAMFAKQKGLDMTNPDEYGRQWAKQLAERLGVPYKGHIEKSDMKRPADFHNARVAYYDGTGSFDPSRVADLPPGFVISRRHTDAANAQSEADVAVSIATGDHGFGTLITDKEPFYLMVVGDPEDPNFSANKLQAEVDAIASNSNGRVKVLGFTRPRAMKKAA